MVISTNELVALIKSDDVVVNKCSRSSNTFGTFLFIGVFNNKTDESSVYYGAGYHEYKEVYMFDEWECFTSTDNDMPRFAKGAIVHQIIEADKSACMQQLGLASPSNNAVLYSNLVDAIGDEDAVLAQMQDMGLT